MAAPAWKLQLVPAGFRGVPFKVDVSTRSSGRRIVLHEFPKRDIPLAEDMGRAAHRFSVTGYVIGPDYKVQRDLLIMALEFEGPGPLLLPTSAELLMQMLVVPNNYSVRERREAGGIAEFEMTFVEAGNAMLALNPSSQTGVSNAADDAQDNTVGTSNSELSNGVGAGQPPKTGDVEIGTPFPTPQQRLARR